MFRLGTLAAIALALAAIPVSAGAVPPAPCNNAPQITDASGRRPPRRHRRARRLVVGGRGPAAGRHPGPRRDLGRAEHDDAAGQRRRLRADFYNGHAVYLRARAPAQRPRRPTRVVYDYGTVAADGGVHAAGRHDRRRPSPAPNGTVTIDVPGGARARGHAADRRSVRLHLRRHQRRRADRVDHAPGGDRAERPGASAPTTSSAPATRRRRRRPRRARAAHRAREGHRPQDRDGQRASSRPPGPASR